MLTGSVSCREGLPFPCPVPFLGVLACFSLLLLDPSLAMANFPSRVGTSLDDLNSPSALALSDDGRLLAVSEKGSGGLVVFDGYAWSAGGQTLSGLCEPAYDVAFVTGTTVSDRFYLACGDGRVDYVDIDATQVPAGLSLGGSLSLNGGTGSVEALAFAEGDLVVHALVSASGTSILERFSVADDKVDATVLPLSISAKASDLAISLDSTALVLPRSDGNLSWISRSGDSYSPSSAFVGLSVALDAAAVSSTAQMAVVASASEGAFYSVGSGSSSASTFGEGWESPGAVVFAEVDGSEVVLLSDSDSVQVLGTDAVLEERVSLDGVTAQDIIYDASASVAYVLGSDAQVHVLTDGPILSELSVEPSSVGAGEDFSISFLASADAAWAVRLSNSAEPLSGEVLGSGDCLAGELVTASFSSDGLTQEGGNRLYVVLDQGLAMDSVEVLLDTPPGVIDGLEAAAGEARIVLSWSSSGESDVSAVEVLLSEASFSADAEGVPSYTDDSGNEYPQSRSISAGDKEHSVSVEELTNGTTYYVALRQVDEGGQAGPVSEVLSVRPDETCGAAECSGDTGGCQCSGVGRSLSPFAACLVFGFLSLGYLLRSRRALLRS